MARPQTKPTLIEGARYRNKSGSRTRTLVSVPLTLQKYPQLFYSSPQLEVTYRDNINPEMTHRCSAQSFYVWVSDRVPALAATEDPNVFSAP